MYQPTNDSPSLPRTSRGALQSKSAVGRSVSVQSQLLVNSGEVEGSHLVVGSNSTKEFC